MHIRMRQGQALVDFCSFFLVQTFKASDSQQLVQTRNCSCALPVFSETPFGDGYVAWLTNKDVKVLRCVQRRATKLLEDLEGMSCEGWLRTLGFSSVEKRRLRCDLIALCGFLRRECGEGGAEVFSLGSSARTCGNGSELPQGRFRLDIRKHFFTESTVKRWNRVPRDLIDAPSLSVFKRHLGTAFNNIL